MPYAFFQWAIPHVVCALIVAFFSLPLFATSHQRPNNLYFVTFHSSAVTARDLTAELEKLNAQQGGKVPLGVSLKGKPYFHFYLPTENGKDLISYLKRLGKIKLSALHDHKKQRQGHQRFILWMQPTSDTLPDISHSTTPLSAQKNKPTLAQTQYIEQHKVASWILDHVSEGPIDVDFTDDQNNNKKLYISPSLTDLQFHQQSHTLIIRATPRKQNCPQIPTQMQIGSESELQQFISDYAICYSFHFDRTKPQKQSLKVKLIQTAPDELILLANETENELFSVKLTESAPSTKPTGQPAPNDSTQLQRAEPEATTTRLRALGSLIQTEKSISMIGELGAESYFGQKGLGLRYFQVSPTAPTNSRMSSVDVLAGYRMLPLNVTTHQNLFPHFIYRSMSVQNIGGSFYGVGIKYQDDFWPSIDQLLEKISWLPQDTTAELSLEYFPLSTTSNVSKVTAYSSYFRGLFHYTPHLSVEVGGQYQSVTFTKNDIVTDQKLFYFQAGMSYLFF